MVSPHIIGIDGGGTRTRALIVAFDGEVLGYGEAGPSNINNRPLMEAVKAITAAVQGASREIATGAKAATCFIGCAGVKSARDGEALRTAVASAGFAAQCVATNDAESALAGGLEGSAGIVLIAGTGSFSLARDSAGRTAQCGGWGWLLDDVGSGFYLGREALRSVAFCSDGRGPRTALTRAVLEHYDIGHADDMLTGVYTDAQRPSQIARLAPLVVAAATTGDAVASAILQHGARGLAELVATVAQGLHLAAPKVVLTGGLVSGETPYAAMTTAAIKSVVPSAAVVPAAFPPVVGAALRALELVNGPASSAALSVLRTGCDRIGLSSPSLNVS